MLPIRWGYTATESPFSGVLEHLDIGNILPASPSFNPVWNASGPAPGFDAYEPHTMPSVVPQTMRSRYRTPISPDSGLVVEWSGRKEGAMSKEGETSRAEI